MRQVSDGFLAAWRGGGRRVQRVYVTSGGSTGEWVHVPHVAYRLDARGGERTVARYSGSVTFPPGTDPGLLDPFSARVQVRAGFVVDGAEELVPVGTLRVEDVEDDHTGALVVTGYSLEKAVEDAGFRYPITVEEGSGVATIKGFLGAVDAPVDVRSPRDWSIPRTVYERDRWAAVRDIATALGVDVYCSADGSFVIAPAPSLDDYAVVTLSAGQVIVGHRRRRSRQGVPSVVRVEGSRVGANEVPPRGLYVDANPYSPTFVGGPFGEVTVEYSSPVLTTDEQCNAAALSIWQSRRGLQRSLSITGVPLDALEPGDVVLADLPSGPELHIVDSLSHSSSGAQSIETRTTGGDA